jgi:hypothetical protein
VIKFNIDHRTNAESSETVKHSNLKLTFTVYFNRAIVSPLLTVLLATTRTLCGRACLFAALPLVFLAAVNASQMSIVGFDEFMKVQAWCADVYSGDQHRLQSFSCELHFCVRPHVIHQGKNALNGRVCSWKCQCKLHQAQYCVKFKLLILEMFEYFQPPLASVSSRLGLGLP